MVHLDHHPVPISVLATSFAFGWSIWTSVATYALMAGAQRLCDGAVRRLRLEPLNARRDLLPLVNNDLELIKLDGVNEGVHILEATAGGGNSA